MLWAISRTAGPDFAARREPGLKAHLDYLHSQKKILVVSGATLTDDGKDVTGSLLIVNVGSRIAELRIAAPADIDTAVELGLNYPKGPLALGDMLGARRVLAVLDGMQGVTRDPKYRATTWLRRRAQLGVSLLTPD